MNALRAVYHLARADFLERVRRYSFLLILGLTLVACYYVHAGRIGINVGGYRGVMNSAWLGAVMTLTVTVLLGLTGFYLINNCLARDEQTGVGQILAATPISKGQYVCGKALSNFAVLSLIVFVLMLAAVPLQWLAGEDRAIHLLPLLAPFVLFALPLAAFISALAVFFETVAWLRGAFGNVLYFILFTALLTLGAMGELPDFTGISFFQPSMQRAALDLPGYHKGTFTFNIGPEVPPRGFDWPGVAWTPDVLTGRAFWLGLTCGLCLLATLLFNRFDTSRSVRRAGRSVLRTGRFALQPAAAKRAPPNAETAAGPAPRICSMHFLPPVRAHFFFLDLFVSELRILLKGMPWWWYAGLLGGIVAGFAVPGDAFPRVLWFAWIWPIRVWSQMGNRETRYQTGEIVFSAPAPVLRQLPATWLAGFAVAIMAASGVLLRMAAIGNWTGVQQSLAGATFIAALALALGAASGSSKLFEVSYTGLWYLGALNATPALDYTQLSAPGNYTAGWLAASAGAILVALAARLARLRFQPAFRSSIL